MVPVNAGLKIIEKVIDQECLNKLQIIVFQQCFEGRSIILIADNTGDVNKGTTTNYVERQYIGNIGKLENCIVAMTVYELINSVPLPLTNESLQTKRLS